MKQLLVYFPVFFVISCGSPKLKDDVQKEISDSQALLNKSIEAHGGDLYETANYQFTFREKVFTFKNNGQEYKYTSEFQTDAGWQTDVLENGNFKRMLGDIELNLSTEAVNSYKESLNSVIYFATIPHKLGDASVHSKHEGETTIKGKKYEQILVTFSEDGGGQDFEDEYYYWINSENDRVDYFAYNYKVNGGGVRFRSAYNTRDVDGVLFQDYVNYSAPVGTPLNKLSDLFQKDSLIEVSRIELVDVKKIK